MSSIAACGSDPQQGEPLGDQDAATREDSSIVMPSDSGVDASDAGLDASLDTDAAVSDASLDIDAAVSDAATISDAATQSDAEADAAPACIGDAFCALSSVHACVAGELEETSCDKGCAEGACNTSCDAEAVVVDQSVADDHAGTGSTTSWQSFQISATGVLTALELRPNVYSATGDASTITLSIYVGEGVAGQRIAQEQYTVPSVGSSPWRTFTFATPVPLQENQTYTWAIEGAKSVWYAESDLYAGGHAKLADRDMTFKLHAAACH